jgi:aspartyl-tRNA(Asn)/glutamyl-tRNA(Gln) amidotransferase subunit A
MQQPWHYLAGGIESFSRRWRNKEFSAEEVARSCLDTISARDSKDRAFVYIARELAMAQAREADRLLASGEDLGPLMGVPVAIKDLYSVTGMPTTAGSRLDISDLVQPEGHFVRMLRAAGCVLLGKTRTTEFALGGINLVEPTPWNPCDPQVHRTPGGSSSGSAVALAAGVCAFSVGSDTGGSVRQPAANSGLVGYKSSHGAWPVDGLFALSATLDSVGWFATSVKDAAIIYNTLRRESPIPSASISQMRLARPGVGHLEKLEPSIARRIESAIVALIKAGATVVDVEMPEFSELDDFAPIVPYELVATLGRGRIEGSRELLDPVARARLDAPPMTAAEYAMLLEKRRSLCRRVAHRMTAFDAWIMPTTLDIATPVNELGTLEAARAWNGRAFRITRSANLFDQCAISIPLPCLAEELPAGIQIVCPHGHDRRLFAMGAAVEGALGTA